MTLEQLESFIAVANAGSFHAAARKQRLSQPTVSARVKALESRLNRRLFLRTHSGVTLTGAGTAFLRYAVGAVRNLSRGQQEAMLDARFSGALALGVQIYLWECLVAPWLAWMQQAAPDLALRIEPDYSEPIMDQIASGVLDLGVLFEPRISAGIVIEPLSVESLWLVAKDRDCAECWPEALVAVYWGEEVQAAFARAFPDCPAARLSLGSSSIALNHILEHGGSALLLARTVQPLVADGRLFRVPSLPSFSRPIYLAYRDASSDDPLLGHALQGLRQVLG
ncbi:MAG: LysR family transcriptional regulator [Rhodospirillales bacterium]